MVSLTDQEGEITDDRPCGVLTPYPRHRERRTMLEANMVNEKNTEASGTCNAIAEKHDGKTVNSETLNALAGLMDEMHRILQLPPEDLAKVDHIEWKLDWKPVLTACLYPKKS